MKIEEIESILKELGAYDVGHTGRKLGDHLIGTYNILKKLNAPDDVCLAGAFHSVYGTNVFKKKIVDSQNRFKVQNLISPKVEKLVYLFSIVNRPKGIDTGNLIVYNTGHKIEVDDDTLEKLRLVEIANLIEQNEPLTNYSKLSEIYGNLTHARNL
jgi:hypothetical protein